MSEYVLPLNSGPDGHDLAELGLVEGRIGDDRADGGVGHKLIFYHLIALIDLVLGTKKGLPATFFPFFQS